MSTPPPCNYSRLVVVTVGLGWMWVGGMPRYHNLMMQWYELHGTVILFQGVQMALAAAYLMLAWIFPHRLKKVSLRSFSFLAIGASSKGSRFL